MLVYGKSFCIRDNVNGHEVEFRDAICSSCQGVVDRQQKYRGIDKEFRFSSADKKNWKFCPNCGKEL